MSRVSGQLWQRAFTNRCNLVIDHTPLLIEGCIPYLLPSNLLSDLCHKMQICLFQHNLLAVTLSQSWRWSPWAVAWKLHPPILLKILRNLCPKSCLQFSTLLHQAQCLHTITLLVFFSFIYAQEDFFKVSNGHIKSPKWHLKGLLATTKCMTCPPGLFRLPPRENVKR